MNTTNYTTTLAPGAVSAADVYNNINAVPKWWSTNFQGASEKVGDIFTVTFGETWITIKVAELTPGKKVHWQVTDCNKHWLKNKKEWVGTGMSWEITDSSEGTQINFTHIGLQPQLECYTGCEKGWNSYLKESLLPLMTMGKGRPN